MLSDVNQMSENASHGAPWKHDQEINIHQGWGSLNWNGARFWGGLGQGSLVDCNGVGCGRGRHRGLLSEARLSGLQSSWIFNGLS